MTPVNKSKLLVGCTVVARVLEASIDTTIILEKLES